MVKQLTTVSEFDSWQRYFSDRLAKREKSDYYAAATIRAIYASQGAKVANNIADYLLEFDPPKTEKPEPVYDSKSMWLGIFNIDAE